MKILLLLLASVAWAGQSLNLGVSTATFVIPNIAAFAGTMGSWKMVWRFHNYATPVADEILYQDNRSIVTLRTDGTILADTPWMAGNLSMKSYVVLAGATDFTLTLERNLTTLEWGLRGYVTPTGVELVKYCDNTSSSNFRLCPIYNDPSGGGYNNIRSFAGPGTLNVASASVRVAFWAWFSGEPTFGGRLPAQYDQGDLISWRLEGNGTDDRGNADLTITNPSYVTTPILAPLSVPKQFAAPGWTDWLSARAGYLYRLDGSSSTSLNDTPTLTYEWNQLSGPSKPTWTNKRTVSPTLSGFVFGTYVLTLKVTDSLGATATTNLQIGSVATDPKGVVVNANADARAMWGDQIAFGQNGWAWADSRHKYMAEWFGDALASNAPFKASWRNYAAGTVSATNGSATLTGVGTSFNTALDCAAGDIYLSIRYPDSSVPDGFRFKAFKVVPGSCTATQLTLRDPWAALPGTTSGMAWAVLTQGDFFTWNNGGSNPNYYDNVLAHYSLYWRSGNEKYRDYARVLADRWFENPYWDYGAGAGGGDITLNGAPRLKALSGLMMRAIDGQPLFWAHLRGQLSFAQSVTPGSGVFDDVREWSYWLQYLAMGARFDPSGVNRASYLASVNALVARFLSNQSSGAWPNEGQTFPGYTVMNNSTVVTGAWLPSYCGYQPSANYTQWVRFQGENYGYRCTYVSPTEAALSEPYRGSTGTKGIQIGNLVGLGSQPFVQGLVANIVAFAGQVGATGASSQLAGAMDWISTTGYYAPYEGLYYGRGFAGCEVNNGGGSGAPASVPECLGTDGAFANRIFAGEALGAWARAYPVTQNPAHRDTGDRLYTVNFGFPGFSLPAGVTNPNGYYNTEAVDGGSTVTTYKAKDYGFFWGMGLSGGWPAVRIGGVDSPSVRTVSLTYVPPVGTTTTSINITSPDGTEINYPCASNRCTFSYDARQGNPLSEIVHVSAVGTTRGEKKTLKLL